MITVNKKWIRLIGIVGCTVWMASCKQAPDAGVKSSYAVMQIEPTDKELSSSYYKHRRTDLQEQQGTVCAESRFRI